MAKGKRAPPRIFLDSGVVLEGLLAPWSASRAILILARQKVLRLILAEYVQGEVEDNLLDLLNQDAQAANELIDAYHKLLQLLKPETIRLPSEDDIDKHRHMIRHQADVPVLVSAMAAAPDWLLTTNTKHFTPQVAVHTHLNIATPQEFLQSMALVD